MSGNMTENAAGFDGGDVVDSAGPSSPQSPAGSSLFPSGTSPERIFSPSQMRRSRRTIRRNLTMMRPFSFDLRDSMQRDARERRLEELRLMEESRLAVSFRFRANPVRKYRPMEVKQSTRPLTIPKSPFSSDDARK